MNIYKTKNDLLFGVVGDVDERDYPIVTFSRKWVIDVISPLVFVILWMSIYIIAS